MLRLSTKRGLTLSISRFDSNTTFSKELIFLVQFVPACVELFKKNKNNPPSVLPQSELTKLQNMFKIELKVLEDELLTRLSAAESNFLGDNLLVEKLESTKHTAAEIEMKVLYL